METIVVKIENTYVSLAHVGKSEGRFVVHAFKSACLPENLIGAEAGRNPALLAAFLIPVLQGSGFPVKDLAVYLGGGTELFSEYRFSETLDEPARAQRRGQTEDSMLAGASAPLYRVKYYEYDGVDKGLSASAVLAADTVFCDRLSSELTKGGYRVTLISSSLSAFAGVAGTVSGLGERVIVLCAEKREMQSALFIDGRLARLARIAKGTDAQDPVRPLLPFITNETKVVLCGSGAKDARFLERLEKAGALSIEAVYPGMTADTGLPGFSGEEGSFPEAFAAAAFFGKEGASSYFSEARDVRKSGVGLRIACIVVFVVAAFACVLPLATLTAVEREKEENLARLKTPFYADAAEKLDIYRALVTEYSELLEAEATLPMRDPSHADMLEKTLSGLLTGTQIIEMYYEKGNGILIDFTTKDVASFDRRKDALSGDKDIFLYEAKLREKISGEEDAGAEEEEEEWHIQIRVTLAPAALEAP